MGSPLSILVRSSSRPMFATTLPLLLSKKRH
jgi:predicted FMN-binding regulatory protein PaiB